ncbi:MAG: preprotein translocase subunit SecE [Bacteroidota bacterium]|nr:preprotein translocase subunit SecE [Bacteroidota bacterium]
MANIKAFKYIQESYNELLHKVSWPTWSELQNSAVVVSIASLIIALVVYAMDISFQTILQQFYRLF